jgi:hypothetical protein
MMTPLMVLVWISEECWGILLMTGRFAMVARLSYVVQWRELPDLEKMISKSKNLRERVFGDEGEAGNCERRKEGLIDLEKSNGLGLSGRNVSAWGYMRWPWWAISKLMTRTSSRKRRNREGGPEEGKSSEEAYLHSYAARYMLAKTGLRGEPWGRPRVWVKLIPKLVRTWLWSKILTMFMSSALDQDGRVVERVFDK